MRKVKKKEKLKLREKKKKKVKRGKERRRKKRMKRRRLKEDVRVLFLWKPLKFLVKREMWRVAEMFLGKTPLEEFENWSDCGPASRARVRVVPDVTDVLVSPSSVITELCEVSPSRSDVEFVEPQSFSLFKKRAHCCTDKQEEMRYEGSPVKAHPLSRRRMTPSTPLQNFVHLPV